MTHLQRYQHITTAMLTFRSRLQTSTAWFPLSLQLPMVHIVEPTHRAPAALQ